MQEMDVKEVVLTGIHLSSYGDRSWQQHCMELIRDTAWRLTVVERIRLGFTGAGNHYRRAL